MCTWSNSIKEAVIGALLTALVVGVIQLIVWSFYLGTYAEKIQSNSVQITSLQDSNKALILKVSLVTNILTRILTHIKISEIEKTAISKKISEVIKAQTNQFHGSSESVETNIMELKKLRNSIMPIELF